MAVVTFWVLAFFRDPIRTFPRGRGPASSRRPTGW